MIGPLGVVIIYGAICLVIVLLFKRAKRRIET